VRLEDKLAGTLRMALRPGFSNYLYLLHGMGSSDEQVALKQTNADSKPAELYRSG
jgi:hypothetical protein